METTTRAGATPHEWAWLASQDLLARWTLPVVSNLNLKISPQSSLKSPGKTPSIKNRRGEIIGITGWTTAPETTPEQLDAWSRDPDLGACVRTGQTGATAHL